MYPVIADPPVLVGAVKLTVALPLLPLAEIPVGAPGAIGAGVTEDDAVEAVPVPIALVAVTVKVYAVPLVSPVTVIGEDVPLAVTAVPPPKGVAFTVYPVITDEPTLLGAEKLTTACPFPPTALTLVGTPGASKLRAGRKPMLLSRKSGSLPYRNAERALLASPYQLPPRNTRSEPEAAPRGSVTDPLP